MNFKILLLSAIVVLTVTAGCRNGYLSYFLSSNPAAPEVTLLTQDSYDNLNPSLSPDGNQIAFVSDRSGNYEIWLMNQDGGNLRNLTDHIAVDRYPAWSPDGSRIAFSSTRSGNWDVWVMNADGSDPRALTTHPKADLAPAWSRDGSKIAFVSYRDLEYSIYIMEADGRDPRKLTTGGNGDWGPAFNPDGSLIAFASSRSGGGDLYLIDTETGSKYTRLTDDPARDMLPAWSPDGTRIAFVSERGGDRDLWLINRDGTDPRPLTRGLFKKRRPLYDVDREFLEGLGYYSLSWSRDGSRITYTSIGRDGKGDIAALSLPAVGPALASFRASETQITFDPEWDLFPAWSPDGKKIVYVKTQGQGFSEIWVMDRDGQNHKRLSHQPFTKFFEPSFSPDQNSVLFFSDQSGNDDVWVMDRDGENLKQLTTHTAADFHPSWSPDGRQIAFISKRTGSNAIWLMERDGTNQKMLVPVGKDDCDLTPVWTSDGKRLIFSARREEGDGQDQKIDCPAFRQTKPPFTSSCPSHLWEVDIKTRKLRQITSGDFHDGRVALRPDGKHIAFTSNRGHSWDLWLVNLDGSGLHRLTDHEGYDGYSAWSPDGKELAFVSDRSGSLDLWTLTLE